MKQDDGEAGFRRHKPEVGSVPVAERARRPLTNVAADMPMGKPRLRGVSLIQIRAVEAIHYWTQILLGVVLLVWPQTLFAFPMLQDDQHVEVRQGSSTDLQHPPAVWRLSNTPELVLGEIGSGPETEFTRPVSVQTVFDTLILVADRQENNIRLFGLDGSLVLTFGRQGGGPGEFQGLEHVLVARGDTLVAWDGVLRRLTFFGVNGSVFRTIGLERPEAEFGRPQLVGVDGGGGFYFSFSRAWVGQTDAVRRPPVNVYWYEPDLRHVHLVTSVPDLEWVSVNGRNGVSVSGARPLSRRSMLFVRNGLLYAGETGEYSISVFFKTTQLRVVERAVPARPVHRRDVRRFRNEKIARGFTPGEAEARYPASLFPETMPVVARVSVDVNDFIWIERFRLLSTEDHLWDIFDSHGLLVATAVTPARATITDIGDDYVVALETGEFDVPLVTRYRLLRDPH